jgi:hypothetical protein
MRTEEVTKGDVMLALSLSKHDTNKVSLVDATRNVLIIDSLVSTLWECIPEAYRGCPCFGHKALIATVISVVIKDTLMQLMELHRHTPLTREEIRDYKKLLTKLIGEAFEVLEQQMFLSESN